MNNIEPIDPIAASTDLSVSTGQARNILIVCFLLYMVNCMDRQVLSVVLEPMKIDLGLTDTQIGMIQSAFLLSIALLAFPISYIVDRWSRRKSLSLMAIIWSISTFITGLGKNFLGVLIPRTFVGAGEAGFSAAGTAMITAVYPHGARAKAMGIFNAAIPLGAGLGVILGGYISVHFGGWRTPFFVFAVPGILLGWAAFFLKDYRSLKNIDESGKIRGLFRSGFSLYKIPTLRWVYISNAMLTTTAYSFMTWGPAYVMRVQNINEEKAGLLIGVLSLTAIIGAPLGGWLADTWTRFNPKGRIYLPIVALASLSLFFVLAVYFEFKGIGLVFGFILGIVIVMPVAPFGALTQDVVTPERKGMAFGMNTFSMYVLGGGWAPIAIGYVSDMMGGGGNGLKWALIIAGGGGILGAAALWIASRTYLADMEKVRGFELQIES